MVLWNEALISDQARTGLAPLRRVNNIPDHIATMPHPATEGGACMEKAMIEATEKQLGLLWNTLGLSAERSDGRSISRNHFVTSPGCNDSNNL